MSIVQEALKKADSSKGPVAEERHNRKNFTRIALLVIFIAMLGFTIRQFLPLSDKDGKASTASITEAIYKPISAINMKADNSPVAETYTDADKPRSAKGRFPDFVLNGIMELVDGPRAIINNVIVASGDAIGGAKVIKIEKDKVLLQKKDSVVTLGME